MSQPFSLPATSKLFLDKNSIGSINLRAEFSTLKGHITAIYEDFHNAFAVDSSTHEFDLEHWSPSWTSGSMRNRTRITEKHVLIVWYKPISGPSVERRLQLLPFLTVSGTTLKFQRWSPSIQVSASCHHFQGSKFYAWCLKKNGTLKWSHIDLDKHIGVEDDKFKSGGRGFASRVRGLKIEKKEGYLFMYAMIQRSTGAFYEPMEQINLSFSLLNKDGDLEWEPSNGAFDRNGIFARFLEDVPFIGFMIAGLHLRAGNTEHASAAAIRATKTTLMFAYSGAVGMALGPVASILLTAAITTQVMILEKRVADAVLTDPTALDRFQKVTLARVVTDGLAEMGGSAGGEITKTWVSKMSGPYLKKISNELVAAAGELGVDTVSEKTGEKFMSALVNVAAGAAMPADWTKEEMPIYPKDMEV